MFKNFATSIFMRRQSASASNADNRQMTRSELQDLFRNEFEVHNTSAIEITARHGNRRIQSYAA